MRKTGQIFVHSRLQLTILYICTVNASVYFVTEYLPPDVKVSVVSFLFWRQQHCSPLNPRCHLHMFICCTYICGDISLTKGQLGSVCGGGGGGGYLKIVLYTQNQAF